MVSGKPGAIQLDSVTTAIKAAHIRLSHSRFFLVVAYLRESQERVFDAHNRAFAFFGGACRRGLYDNMKTAVTRILRGKERDFNRRFEQLCSTTYLSPWPARQQRAGRKAKSRTRFGQFDGGSLRHSARPRIYGHSMKP